MTVKKVLCVTCSGKGIIDGGPYRPSVACPNCYGKGKAEEGRMGESSAVMHPQHYNEGKFEVIDVIEDWKLGFNDGNAIKYIARHRYKGNPKEDLKKALWYLARELAIQHQTTITEITMIVATVIKEKMEE
jgi:hypothetical protein